MPKIVIYKGKYQYDAVNSFADDLALGFNKLGRDTVFIDFADSSTLAENLKRELSGDVELIISFGAIGHDLKVGDNFLHDILPVPYVAVLVDHPAHHYNRLEHQNITITCYARSHVEYLNRCFNNSKNVFFMPHGGCLADESDKEYSRHIDLLLAASFIDPAESYRKIDELDSRSKSIASEAIGMILAVDCMPIEKAVESAAANRGINIFENQDNFHRYGNRLIHLTEYYIRAQKRFKLLSVLDDAGIVLDIYGNNWLEGVFKQHRLHGPASFKLILNLMRKSKIVLNTIMVPGSHERVFSAMLNGAVVLSDSNQFYQDFFKDGEDLLLYRWTQIDKLPGIIKEALSSPEKLAQIAAAGQQKAMAEHTWEKRAEMLLGMLKR